jgi:hypothetical protein
MAKSRTDFAAVSPPPRLALSIREFCWAHSISAGFYFKLKKRGEGPREMKLGARTLISFEAATEWRRARENRHGRDPPESPDRSERKTRSESSSKAKNGEKR